MSTSAASRDVEGVIAPGGGSAGGVGEWAGDRRAMADGALLAQLVELLGLGTPAGFTWRAATVTLFATDPAELTAGVVHHVQDLGWPVSEVALLSLAAALLLQRAQDLASRVTPQAPPS